MVRIANMVLALALNLAACDRAPQHPDSSSQGAQRTETSVAPAQASRRADFAAQLRPILEARCQPCHFAGGKMYERLPLDRPETIRALGTKLLSRIEDEKARQLIRDFLAQQ
jgi:hypothetical protein